MCHHSFSITEYLPVSGNHLPKHLEHGRTGRFTIIYRQTADSLNFSRLYANIPDRYCANKKPPYVLIIRANVHDRSIDRLLIKRKELKCDASSYRWIWCYPTPLPYPNLALAEGHPFTPFPDTTSYPAPHPTPPHPSPLAAAWFEPRSTCSNS